MGATEEQMHLLDGAGVDHVSYVFILYSIAFLVYLFVNMLLHLYGINAMPVATKHEPERPRANGHLPDAREAQRIRDEEEFELHDLASDDEEADEAEALVKKETRRAAS
jgi:hypothetical protein